jgi:hypothetical protein
LGDALIRTGRIETNELALLSVQHQVSKHRGGEMISADEQREDDRRRRRDLTCITTGLAAGAGLGVLAGAFVATGGMILAAIGALVGAVGSKLIARHISADDWDPPLNRRSYVGTRSPDGDDAPARA